MAEGRMLKRAVAKSRRLAQLKNDTHRLIYTWIIPFLDYNGCYYADPSILKGDIFPRLNHITPRVITAALVDLVKNDLIMVYPFDGDDYLQLRKFEDHQINLRKDREPASTIPPPDGQSSKHPDDFRQPSGEMRGVDGKNRGKLREEKRREEKELSGKLPDWIKRDLWKAFLDMREKIKQPPTEKAVELIIAKLEKFKKQGYDPNECLEASIENNWRGVFEPKGKKISLQGVPVNTTSPWTICPKCKKEVLKSDLEGNGCLKCLE